MIGTDKTRVTLAYIYEKCTILVPSLGRFRGELPPHYLYMNQYITHFGLWFCVSRWWLVFSHVSSLVRRCHVILTLSRRQTAALLWQMVQILVCPFININLHHQSLSRYSSSGTSLGSTWGVFRVFFSLEIFLSGEMYEHNFEYCLWWGTNTWRPLECDLLFERRVCLHLRYF